MVHICNRMLRIPFGWIEFTIECFEWIEFTIECFEFWVLLAFILTLV